MKDREIILKNIIYFFMIFTLVYIFGLAIGLDLALPLQFTIVAILSFFVKFLIFNPILIYIIVILSLLSILLTNHFYPEFILPFLEKTTSLLSNIFHNLAGRENIAGENLLAFWIILLVLTSLATTLIIFKKKSDFILLPIYLSFFIYYWYTYIDPAYWMMVIFLLLFLILMTLNKYDQEVSKKDKLLFTNLKNLFPSWIKTGVIYSLIIIILAVSLPKSKNIVQWSWLEDKLYEIFPGTEFWRSSGISSRKYGKASYFDFSITGYDSMPSKLGGPIELSDEVIMTIYSDQIQYLRGNIKHRYTGDYWEILGSPLSDYRPGNDLSGISKLDKKRFHESSTITVKFNSFSSKTIFAPYKPARINYEDNTKILLDNDYGISIKNGIYSGESYSVTFEKLLPYEELIGTSISYRKDSIIDLYKYLEIPEDRITRATKDLTRNIVKNLNNDFDKAMAMEEYLRKNYEYSLDVNIVPEGHEFIDYFLFHEQKGYCTYYATTLAIMLRLENIPSRYVEGFIAKDLKKKGVYEVTQKNAHAWVEAFIEPFGWIRLEATPAYPSSPGIIGSTSLTSSPSLIEENLNSTLPDREVLLEEGKKIENEDSIENTFNSKEEDLVDVDDNKRDILKFFLIIVLSILPIRFLFVFTKNQYKNYKINSLSDRRKIIYIYDDILKFTEALGHPMEVGETYSEYANRVSFEFYYYNYKGIADITEIFIKTKYGNSPISKEDLETMLNFKKNLKTKTRSSLGFLRYLSFYLKN